MRRSSLSFFLLSLAVCAISGQAQSYQPQQVYLGASAFVEGHAMYVAGGYDSNDSEPVGQMFWIDLSTPWSTSSPAYNRLLDGVIFARAPSALVDNNNWFFLVNQTAYIYNIPSSKWTNITTDSTITPALGLAAAVDPNTKNVYVPNVESVSTIASGISLFIYSFSDRTIRHDSTQETLKNLINYNAVWAPTLNSMLVFGGNINEEWSTQNSLYAYNTAAGWSSPPVSGDIPPPRTLACLVPAYSGTKMILYGGFASSTTTNSSGPPFNDIYVLDVATYTWTKGSSSSTDPGRGGQACAVSGDYFIVWGGYSVLASTSLTMVYNMKTDSWVANYTPPPSSPSSHTGAIIGGCIGAAVALILLVAGFIWYRKRSHKARSNALAKGDESSGSMQQESAESDQHPQAQQQVFYPPYEPQSDQKQKTSYEMASIPTDQQPQYIYQPPILTIDPTGGYYPPPMSQEAGYYQPVEQPQHDYQPPVITTTDQAAGYYQPAEQQPLIYQPSSETSDATHFDNEAHHHRVSVLDTIATSPQSTSRSPQLDHASYHDDDNHRASVLSTATSNNPQSYRSPQTDLPDIQDVEE